MKKFEIIFLEEAANFIGHIEEKPRLKILFNLRKAQILNDPKLFKKLQGNVWEFRTKYENIHYRLFAFWDKREQTLVVTTHGVIKKKDKVSKSDIEKVEAIRIKYFTEKEL